MDDSFSQIVFLIDGVSQGCIADIDDILNQVSTA